MPELELSELEVAPVNDDVTLSKEIAPVFEQIKTLAPALDIALDTPLQIPVKV